MLNKQTNIMKLLNTQSVKVGEMTFPVKLTNRAMIEYENLSGANLSKLNNTEDIIQLFYCTAKAGAKSIGIAFNHSYEDFLDLIDDYYTDVITNFTKVLSEESGGDGKKQKTNQ